VAMDLAASRSLGCNVQRTAKSLIIWRVR
jgi:hypothetical protein